MFIFIAIIYVLLGIISFRMICKWCENDLKRISSVALNKGDWITIYAAGLFLGILWPIGFPVCYWMTH